MREKTKHMARRGIELYPRSADVRAFFAFAPMHSGNYREAEQNFRAAVTLNPFYPNWYRERQYASCAALYERV